MVWAWRAGAAARVEEKRRREEELRRQEAARLEAQYRAAEEKRMVQRLFEVVESYTRWQAANSFLEACRDSATDSARAKEWLAWAEDVIARSNPLQGAESVVKHK